MKPDWANNVDLYQHLLHEAAGLLESDPNEVNGEYERALAELITRAVGGTQDDTPGVLREILAVAGRQGIEDVTYAMTRRDELEHNLGLWLYWKYDDSETGSEKKAAIRERAAMLTDEELTDFLDTVSGKRSAAR